MSKDSKKLSDQECQLSFITKVTKLINVSLNGFIDK